jgi:hypothetical protein
MDLIMKAILRSMRKFYRKLFNKMFSFQLTRKYYANTYYLDCIGTFILDVILPNYNLTKKIDQKPPLENIDI